MTLTGGVVISLQSKVTLHIAPALVHRLGSLFDVLGHDNNIMMIKLKQLASAHSLTGIGTQVVIVVGLEWNYIIVIIVFASVLCGIMALLLCCYHIAFSVSEKGNT